MKIIFEKVQKQAIRIYGNECILDLYFFKVCYCGNIGTAKG